VFSSMMGIMSMEGGSIYSASKFALEGWVEGLKTELKHFGIRCMLVEPGPFRTDFVNEKTSVKFSDIEIEDYKIQREAMQNLYVSFHGKEPGEPAKLAKAFITAVNDSNPPLRLLVGKGMVGAVEQFYQARLSEYDAWREISDSTNFE
jgi:short-subunit dehydrogenase